MLTLHGHIAPQDKAACDYVYVPFDTPEDVERIDVRYEYSHPRHHGDFQGSGNTIDIGLFDPRGHAFIQGDGFRGWSGSDRAHIFVGEFESAPGYIQGPIPAGRWHVILGLYRVAEEGCDYRLSVEFTPSRDAQTPALPAMPDMQRVLAKDRAGLPSAARWYRGDLQAHTHHSDAKGSLATLIATARARGLDFLAVTDHNTITQNLEFDAEQPGDLLLIPAEEVTTYYGHMNVWGVRNWVDFRARTVDDMNRIVASAHERGYLTSVNHPKPGGPAWEYGDAVDFDCVEVWQAPWPYYNQAACEWWDALLQRGRRVIAVGGSDYHQPGRAMEGNPHLPGEPTTWVYAEEFSAVAILDAIRRGRVFISAGVEGPQLRLSGASAAGTHSTGAVLAVDDCVMQCRVLGAAGQTLRVVVDGQVAQSVEVASDDWTYTHRLRGARRYARAEVGQNTQMFGQAQWVMSALSNALFFGEENPRR